MRIRKVHQTEPENPGNDVPESDTPGENPARRTARIGAAARSVAGRTSGIAQNAKEVSGNVARNARTRAAGASEKLVDGAQTVGSVALNKGTVAVRGVGQGAKNAAALAGRGGQNLKNVGTVAWDAIDDKLLGSWEVVSQAFKETVSDSVRAKVLDDKSMQTVFDLAYSALPADVRRWVSPEQFSAFCFKNRNKIMALQASPENPALPPANTVRRVDL